MEIIVQTNEANRRADIDVEDYSTVMVTFVGKSTTSRVSVGFYGSPNAKNKESSVFPTVSGQNTSNSQVVTGFGNQDIPANGVFNSAFVFNVAALKRFRVAVVSLTAPFDIVFTLSKVPTAFIPQQSQTVNGTVTVGTNVSTLGDVRKLEDAPHVSGDSGIPAWAVRNDNASTVFASASGDYSPISVDGVGKVFVSGTYNEDSAHTDQHYGNAVMGVRAPATPVAQTGGVGRYGMIAVDAEGKQIASGSASPDQTVRGMAATNGQTNVQLIPAPAVGLRLYVTDVIISGNGTAGVAVILKSANNDFARINSNQDHVFKTPLRLNAAEALNAVIETGASNVWVTVVGYLAV